MRSAARRPAPVVIEEDDDVDDDDAPRKSRKKGSSAGKYAALAMVLAFPLMLGGYFFQGRMAAQRNREIKKQLDAATEQLKHDSLRLLQEGLRGGRQGARGGRRPPPPPTATWPTPTPSAGASTAAATTRRKRAEEHLASAKKSGEISSHLYAAEALVKTYGGKGKDALTELEGRVKKFDDEGKRSSLLYLTLGLIQMNAGDLDRAKDNLEKAQGLSPDDPRIYAALGAAYRRLGQDAIAWKNYDFALRYEKDHPESLLGKSLLMLEQDEPNFGLAAQMIKKLLEAEPPPSPRQLAAATWRARCSSRACPRPWTSSSPRTRPSSSRPPGCPPRRRRRAQEMLKAEETGFALDKQNPELSLIKGRRLLSENEFDKAAEEIRKAIKIDATRAQFYVELSKALMGKTGGEKEAAEALVTAIKTMGDSPKLLTMLGNAYRKQNKLNEALDAYKRSVKEPNAKNPEARLAMGTIYRERGEWDDGPGVAGEGEHRVHRSAGPGGRRAARAGARLRGQGRCRQGRRDVPEGAQRGRELLPGLLLLRGVPQEGPEAGRQGQAAGAAVHHVRAQGRVRDAGRRAVSRAAACDKRR